MELLVGRIELELVLAKFSQRPLLREQFSMYSTLPSTDCERRIVVGGDLIAITGSKIVSSGLERVATIPQHPREGPFIDQRTSCPS
jgi:hypothetical protein